MSEFDRITALNRNRPQTLTGIETIEWQVTPRQPQIEIDLKPLQGLKR